MSTQSENSLMKKTKKELVDIILRKDDVEAKLRKEKADVELDFNKAKEMISKKDTVINNLNKDIKGTEDALLKEQKNNAGLESSIDDLTTENTELISRNKKLFTYAFVEGLIIVGLAILCFCL
jgi:hypothetical protein